jgi:hypothetical protein
MGSREARKIVKALPLAAMGAQAAESQWRSWARDLADALELVLAGELTDATELLERFRADTPCPHGFTKPTCGQCL